MKELNRRTSSINKISKHDWISVGFIDYNDFNRRPTHKHEHTIDLLIELEGDFNHLKVEDLVNRGAKISTMTWLMNKNYIDVRTPDQYITYIQEYVIYNSHLITRDDLIKGRNLIIELDKDNRFELPDIPVIPLRLGQITERIENDEST